MDLEEIKRSADLFALVGRDTSLKKVSSSPKTGDEYAGACPLPGCGGDDRFRVQPRMGRWLCRRCTEGKWRDVITYIALRDRLNPQKYQDLMEICRRAVPGQDISDSIKAPRSNEPAPPPPLYTPPPADWQHSARRVVDLCQSALNSSIGERAAEYLSSRGLVDHSIQYHQLGYSEGFNIDDLYIPRGIVIPCIVEPDIWYLKISLLPGDITRCEKCGEYVPAREPCENCGKVNKYRGVRGNRPAAIFNANSIMDSKYALSIEGEFDCMVAYQVLGDILPCVTFGASTNTPDDRVWGKYLNRLDHILAAYDRDEAGSLAVERLKELYGKERLNPVPYPEGIKDLNNYYLAGGDLWEWINIYLDYYDILKK